MLKVTGKMQNQLIIAMFSSNPKSFYSCCGDYYEIGMREGSLIELRYGKSSMFWWYDLSRCTVIGK